MGEIVLTRVDERLIHGVIMATWVPSLNIEKVIAVDDETAKDDFIKEIMKSCTNGLPAEIYTLDQAVEAWEKEEFGNGRILLLFKRISDAVQAYGKGIAFSELQLGWLNPGPGKVRIDNRICLSKEEVKLLEKFEQDTSVSVHVRYAPEMTPVSFGKAISGKI